MIPIKMRKSQQKYKCYFCNKRGVKRTLEKHEPICWKNPMRFCPMCENTGIVLLDDGLPVNLTQDCPYCSKFDKDIK